MIRNPEQTIGKLADNAGYAVCSFIDEQGYPDVYKRQEIKKQCDEGL